MPPRSTRWRSTALALLSGVLGCRAHVPTYDGGADNCFKPPHSHKISQVVYLKGSGGLEIHFDGPSDPFDMRGGERILYDVTMKHKYDQSSYTLHVGCGGCIASIDPIVEAPVKLDGYPRSTLEPFTQTWGHHLFDKDNGYNSENLMTCNESHWTIRLVDYHNRTTEGHETLVWGAVLADPKEWFTAQELIEFPIYVLNNHGWVWSGLPGTWWIVLIWTYAGLVGLSLYVKWGKRERCRFEGWATHFDDNVILDPRNWLLFFSTVGWASAMIEMFAHLLYAQTHVPVAAKTLLMGLGVVFVANGFPLALTRLIWRKTVYGRDRRHCWPCLWDWKWGHFELVVGVSFYFLLGSGFYIGPSFMILDALVRLYEGYTGWRPESVEMLKEQPVALPLVSAIRLFA